jgi:TPR repeat protein
MVGYMHLTGMGADKDPALASAWYRLAAERDTPEFVALRDRVMQELPSEQRVQSDAAYRKLRRDYSDLAVLLRSIRHHVHELQARSGAGVTSTPASITVFSSQTSMRATVPTSDYYARIRLQLRDQLRKLAALGDFADLETDPSKVNVDEVERLVNERIAATDP